MTVKNILYIHPSNELYGADRSLLRLVSNLDQSRYRAHVVIGNDLPYEGLLTNELVKTGATCFSLNMSILRRRYFSPAGLLRLAGRGLVSTLRLIDYVRHQEIALIHSNSLAVPVGAFVSRITGVPHLWHVREILTHPVWLNPLMARLLYHGADGVIAVSNPVRNHLVQALPQLAAKTWVVHNGLELAPFDQLAADARQRIRAAWHISDDTVVVGSIGRISAWKGQTLLVRAMSQLGDLMASSRLVFVGGTVSGEEGQMTQLERTISELDLERSVLIEEFRADIPAVLAALDVFVLPSTRPDPFPTVVLEAMAARQPVVATAHGGPLEQVVHGETGFLVSPDDPTQMADAIRLLILQPALRRQLGENGRQRLEAHFSVASNTRQIVDIYQRWLK